MISSRRLRLLSGLAASIIGLLVIVLTVLDLLHREIQSITVIYLSILSLALLGVGASAILYNRSGNSLWRTCLWVSTGLLIAGAVFGLASIGVFLLPSILLAVLASVSSSKNHRVVTG
jgi:VIT1/CCC1 family predicted Fe2+/Mn2+ transporter